MILNNVDERICEIDALNKILEEFSKYPSNSLKKDYTDDISKKIYKIKQGVKGEKEAAEKLRYLKENSEDEVIIHGISLKTNTGDNCQIDHILIHKSLTVFILENKNWKKININERGEWGYVNHKGEFHCNNSSPIEQNKNHIRCIESFINDFIKDNNLNINPQFKSFIIISSDTVLDCKNDNISNKILRYYEIRSKIEDFLKNNPTDANISINTLKKL